MYAFGSHAALKISQNSRSTVNFLHSGTFPSGASLQGDASLADRIGMLVTGSLAVHCSNNLQLGVRKSETKSVCV